MGLLRPSWTTSVLQRAATEWAAAAGASATPWMLTSCSRYAAQADGILPDEVVGAGGGGMSQQKAQEMQAQLDPYDPHRYQPWLALAAVVAVCCGLKPQSLAKVCDCYSLDMYTALLTHLAPQEQGWCLGCAQARHGAAV
jgi:hypothetical protein